MWKPSMSNGPLQRTVEATQAQLQQLATMVAELTASVKVLSVQHEELQRRTELIEKYIEAQRARGDTTTDQRKVSAQMVLLAAFISLLSALLLSALSHIPWR